MNVRLLCLFLLAPVPVAALDCGLYEAIEPGDSLSAIAQRCDTTLENLYSSNPELDPLDLPIGGVVSLAPPTHSTPTGDGSYQTLIGSYSEDGICIGKEVIATLDVNYVEFGETQCTLSDVQVTQGSFLLLATECLSEGETSPDQTIQITPLQDNAIRYIGSGDWQLERCTDL
ncbi:LysM peptidoglycan-binding domain-containing protein [Octadecabacter sp.]|nr:LysM peptidoglycan-binding domain-containing protein [Octadecabacter sp.]